MLFFPKEYLCGGYVEISDTMTITITNTITFVLSKEESDVVAIKSITITSTSTKTSENTYDVNNVGSSSSNFYNKSTGGTHNVTTGSVNNSVDSLPLLDDDVVSCQKSEERWSISPKVRKGVRRILKKKFTIRTISISSSQEICMEPLDCPVHHPQKEEAKYLDRITTSFTIGAIISRTSVNTTMAKVPLIPTTTKTITKETTFMTTTTIIIMSKNTGIDC